MFLRMIPFTIKASTFLGLFFISAFNAGSVASARAAKVSIIRFTQSICVTVSGNSTPTNGPMRAVSSARRFMVSWNCMNFWIFR